MKKFIWPVIVGLLSTIIFIEATTDFDIIDEDSLLFCEEIVIDTVYETRVVRMEGVKEIVEIERIDTFLQEHFYLDTIYSTELSFIRDTIFSDSNVRFVVDTLSFPNAELRYGILGNVIGFYPSLSVNCPKLKLRRWSLYGGYESRGNVIGGVGYRVGRKTTLQVIGGVGNTPFGGLMLGYHL
jgi:hypothetical protein